MSIEMLFVHAAGGNVRENRSSQRDRGDLLQILRNSGALRGIRAKATFPIRTPDDPLQHGAYPDPILAPPLDSVLPPPQNSASPSAHSSPLCFSAPTASEVPPPKCQKCCTFPMAPYEANQSVTFFPKVSSLSTCSLSFICLPPPQPNFGFQLVSGVIFMALYTS
ncbi:hypothetical protein QR680_005769 [Steinernema hermaphroditum]|uniref:Uncharacterized protein n=1 Tax=Steinernema hermaphroditum TaxID=289476 RepID=A0AA39HUD0_9BILA|nr:hypothetical protein QR680_005769 [Steinernema hermaphroditum]